MLLVFSDTLSSAGSLTFVIDRRRVCSSCFLIRSRAPGPGLLGLTDGARALRVF